MTKRNGRLRLLERLAEGDMAKSRLLVALDFDGTLADIVETPKAAVMTAKTRRLLSRLVRLRGVKIAILSGRALRDVKTRVGLEQVYYGGNHGLEISGPNLRWTHPGVRPLGAAVREALLEDLKRFPGVRVEFKGPGAAIHYREMPPRFLRALRAAVERRFPRPGSGFRLLHGKKTLDARPDVPWNKAHALDVIRRSLGGQWSVIFIGDDATDEEAFRALGPAAVTVRIGRAKSSAAQFTVAPRAAVDGLLESLASRRRGRPVKERSGGLLK